MRITDGMKYQSLLRDINRAQQRVLKAQEQVTSGKKVNKPSDNPVAASDILRINSEKAENEQFSRNLSFAQAKLHATEGAVNELESMVERALTVAQMSHGHPESKEAYVSELNGLRDQIMFNAGTTYAGRFIFGGSITTQQPYVNTGTGIVYNGNSDPMALQISRGSSVPTQIPGSDLYSGTINIFNVIDSLVAAVQAENNTGIQTGIDSIRSFTEVVSMAQTKIGNYLNLTSSVANDLTAAKLANETELSNKEAADLAAAITELTVSQNGLQATLATGANISQLSLLNYMR